MASEITDQDVANSPSNQDDALGNGNGAGESRGLKRARTSTTAADDDDDDDGPPGRERRKIEIKFIQDKSRRHITFSKRKAGIMKKAYELSVLTGTQVLLLVVSETGLVYTFTTPKLQPLVTKPEGKNLIQACLNAPEPADGNGVDGGESTVDSPEDAHSSTTATPGVMPSRGGAGMQPAGYAMSADQQQALQYQAYLQQQQAQQQGGYPMPTQGMAQRHQ